MKGIRAFRMPFALLIKRCTRVFRTQVEQPEDGHPERL